MATKTEQADAPDNSEFQKFVDDIEELIKETTTLTGDELTRASDKLRERIALAKLSTSVMGGVIAGQATKAAEATDEYVNAKPWSAVGISAVVGLVIGLLLARR
jgi:ElaB/YqjD/DUF883 family membrane-anchored ribosome-binding protein